jgi:glycosyltransferase involved in cell wall biosynthesis
VIPVAINGRFLGQRITGVQRHARELLRAMDVLVAGGSSAAVDFGFSLLTPRGTPAAAPFRTIPIRQVGSLQGHLWEQIDLRRYVGGTLLLNLCNTAPLTASNMVATIHDASVYAVPQAYSRPFRTWYRFVIPRLGNRARRIVTVSRFSKAELQRYAGIAADRITVISGGGEHILAEPADQRIIERLRLTPGAYVVAVGSLSPHKNLAGVAEAAKKLARQGVQTVVTGGINSEVFSSRPPAEHSHLRLTGYISDGELRALYEQAACLVYPSLYEGFGLPPLEAMSCGCPVVASRAASLPEVCGDAAAYCDPADPADIAAVVQQVVSDRSRQEDMRRRGTGRARQFSWSRAAGSMLTLLAELHQ